MTIMAISGKSKGKDKLTEQEKIFCIQRAKGSSSAEAYKLSYDCSRLNETSVYNRASRLDRKDKIRNEIKLCSKPLVQAAAAKTIIASEIWDSSTKNQSLLDLSTELRSQIYDEDGRILPKIVDCYLKTIELSAKLTGQLTHNVNIKSEAINYSFNLGDNSMKVINPE